MMRTAPSASRRADARQQLRVLGVGVLEDLGRVGDVGDEVGHLPLGLGRQRDQARAMGRLGQADVEAHVGLAVAGKVFGHVVHRADELVERCQLVLVRPRRGQRRDPQLDA